MLRHLVLIAMLCVFITSAKVVKKDQAKPEANAEERKNNDGDVISGVGPGVFRKILGDKDKEIIGK